MYLDQLDPSVIALAAEIILCVAIFAIGRAQKVYSLKRRYRFSEAHTACPECGENRFRKGSLAKQGFRYTCLGCGTTYAFVPGVGIVDKLGQR